MSEFRIGTGYDIHPLVEGRRLILGGVEIPFEKGLQGHSDADALTHAVCDALLGASSLGDIGRHFPDSDPRWKGASSLDLLSRVVELIGERGFAVSNIDAVIVTERPRLAPFIEEMRSNLAAALEIEMDRVSLKAKTNEGLDAVGRGEAIAAHAVAMLIAR
jgi:2-C-methyl-D-erythritol 2,4-cyclodiphosphate synthase